MKRPLLPVLPLIIVAAVVAVLAEHSNRCVAAVSTILKVWKGSDISFMMMRMPVGLSYLQTTLKFTGYIDLFDAFHDPMPNILTFSEQKGIECIKCSHGLLIYHHLHVAGTKKCTVIQ